MNIMTKKLKEIINDYSLILDGDDASSAFEFVSEVLEAEADALKQSEPYARRTISDIENAARVVSEMAYNIPYALGDD